jgi:hypothetical protein
MQFRFILFSFCMMGALSGETHAQTLAQLSQPLHFSEQDARFIQRNKLLRDLVAMNPSLIRQTLDLIESGTAFPAIDGINAEENPDLFRKESANAAAPAAKPRTRSAEGSIELIEMLRKAKEAKEATQK